MLSTCLFLSPKPDLIHIPAHQQALPVITDGEETPATSSLDFSLLEPSHQSPRCFTLLSPSQVPERTGRPLFKMSWSWLKISYGFPSRLASTVADMHAGLSTRQARAHLRAVACLPSAPFVPLFSLCSDTGPLHCCVWVSCPGFRVARPLISFCFNHFLMDIFHQLQE